MFLCSEQFYVFILNIIKMFWFIFWHLFAIGPPTKTEEKLTLYCNNAIVSDKKNSEVTSRYFWIAGKMRKEAVDFHLKGKFY